MELSLLSVITVVVVVALYSVFVFVVVFCGGDGCGAFGNTSATAAASQRIYKENTHTHIPLFSF